MTTKLCYIHKTTTVNDKLYYSVVADTIIHCCCTLSYGAGQTTLKTKTTTTILQFCNNLRYSAATEAIFQWCGRRKIGGANDGDRISLADQYRPTPSSPL